MPFIIAISLGIFVFGLGISFAAWNSGERGLHIFIWPVAFLFGFFIIGLMVKMLDPDVAHRLLRGPYKFPEPKVVQPDADLVAGDEDFGPELFRCRPLAFMKYVENQGGPVLMFLVFPFVILPMLAAMGALLVPGILMAANFLAGHDLIPTTESWWWGPLFATGFVLTYGAGVWFCYIAPLRSRLIVCNGGFKVRCPMKNIEVLFRDLLEINFGRELVDVPTGTQREVRPSGLGVGAAMNLQLKSGRTVTIKGFLLQFESEDTEKFLDYVEERHPVLFLERAYLTTSPTGFAFNVTDSKWKSRQQSSRKAPAQDSLHSR